MYTNRCRHIGRYRNSYVSVYTFIYFLIPSTEKPGGKDNPAVMRIASENRRN